MFKHIMVPVDLAHVDKLGRALDMAGLLAKTTDAQVTYVGVTAGTPTELAHNPEEYADKLGKFAADEGRTHGIQGHAKVCTSHDPAVDLNDTLLEAAEELAVDCIVVASHVPTIADRVWPSHGGTVARRAKASVFIIR